MHITEGMEVRQNKKEISLQLDFHDCDSAELVGSKDKQFNNFTNCPPPAKGIKMSSLHKNRGNFLRYEISYITVLILLDLLIYWFIKNTFSFQVLGEWV